MVTHTSLQQCQAYMHTSHPNQQTEPGFKQGPALKE